MTREKTAEKVQAIFTEYFDIPVEHFDWEQPLEALHANFEILSHLVLLEQLIQKNFGMHIPIIENISTAFHTPKDVLELIIREL